MARLSIFALIFAQLACAAAESPPPSTTPNPAEFSEARAWFEQFQPAAPGTANRLPISFKYDGHSFAELSAGWSENHSERALDEQRQERVITLTDPKTGLEMRCVAVSYRDYPTVEWTVYFKNTGASDTPILADVNALDARWQREGAEEFLLHHEFGTFFPFSPTDFMPQASRLEPGQHSRFIPLLGRPSGGVMPYFNLERGAGDGVIVVVGWPGAWVSEFSRDDKTGIRVTAGQELVHLRLHPGEEIRTPLMVVQFWRGDWIGAQNTWRRWMLAHNLPKPFGEPLRPMLMATSSAQFGEMIHANEANQLEFMDR